MRRGGQRPGLGSRGGQGSSGGSRGGQGGGRGGVRGGQSGGRLDGQGGLGGGGRVGGQGGVRGTGVQPVTGYGAPGGIGTDSSSASQEINIDVDKYDKKILIEEQEGLTLRPFQDIMTDRPINY